MRFGSSVVGVSTFCVKAVLQFFKTIMGASKRERDEDISRGKESKKKKHSRESEHNRESGKEKERERNRDRDYDKEKEKDSSKKSKHVEEREKSRKTKEEPLPDDEELRTRVKKEKEDKLQDQKRGSKRQRSPTPEEGEIADTSGGGDGSSLSIEETNKLRARLGLKPLDVGTSSGPKDDEGEGDEEPKKPDFVHVPAVNITEKKKAEEVKRKLDERRERRKLESKLAATKTLGEEDSVDDLSAWVERSRKLQKEKEEAAKRAKALEELDAEFGVDDLVSQEYAKEKSQSYTSRDLRGLKVEHEQDNFEEGRVVVLTLKDKGVLDEEEGDVLVNVNMADDERHKKNVELRKQKPGYNAYDDSEVDELGMPKQKSVLAKYDEELEGEQKKSFMLGEKDDGLRKANALEAVKARLQAEQKKLETLESPVLKVASEYYTAEEMVSFKKIKKKVRKVRKKDSVLKADDLLKESLADTAASDLGSRGDRSVKRKEEEPKESKEEKKTVKLDQVKIVSIPEIVDEVDDTEAMDVDLAGVNFDDEVQTELQLALSKARKLKQAENKKNSIEQIAVEVAQKREKDDAEAAGKGSMVLNATAEFCRALGDIPTYGQSGNRDDDEDQLLDFERELMEERRKKLAEDQEEEEIQRGRWNEVEMDERSHSQMSTGSESNRRLQETVILDEEPDVGVGVGAALKLAMSKGYLEKEEKKQIMSAKFLQLQAQRYSIEDKSVEDDKYSRRERYAGSAGEFKEKEGYKPDVKLEYIDDSGHMLSSKEAFRYLSHKFHGKGSGKQKSEKRTKQAEQKTLMTRMSSTDTPLATLSKLQEKQKELQSPYVVLSGTHKHTGNTLGKTKQKK